MIQPSVEFGVRHLPTGELFEGFPTRLDAFTWLHEHPELETSDCEVVRRERVWSDWRTDDEN